MISGTDRARRMAVYLLAFVVAVGLAGAASYQAVPRARHLAVRVLDHVRIDGSDGSDSGSGSSDGSGRPNLFADSQVATVDPVVDPQAAKARELMAAWWAGHDSGKHDDEFISWLKENAPQPPPPDVRSSEVAELHTLAAARTPDGLAAAQWLDDNGKDVAWTDLAHQIASDPGAIDAGDLKDMAKMTDDLVDQLKNRFSQPSPYVMDPSLSAGQDSKPKHHCVCSYPSGHATASAAAATYLSGVDPGHAGDYRKFRDQVEFSRLYVAGHIPSDLAAGTLLGDAVGEYFLVTRAGMPVPH